MLTLVTGATGLVGNNVVRCLLDRGQSVRVLVREGSDTRPFQGLDIERIEGDVRDRSQVRAACRNVSRIVHSAAVVHIGWSGLKLQREINVEGTCNVAHAAREVDARLLYVSTVDTIGLATDRRAANEETPFQGKVACSYVVSKREAEDAIDKLVSDGLQAVVVNPGFMLGPWDWKPSSGRMLLKVGKFFAPLAPPGGLSVCDVRDVAGGIEAALDRGQVGRRYILAGHNCSIIDLWRQFKRITGGRPPLAKAWVPTVVVAGWLGDLIARVSGREPDINSAAAGMSRLHHFYDSQRATRELGYRRRPLEETIQDAWDWFRQQGYA